MRYVRIFSLFFENVLQYRARIFIWFLIAFLNPLLYLLYWRGVYLENKSLTGWSFSDLSAYYFILIVADGLLITHHEEDAYEDIQMGRLAIYLTKPLSYLRVKFFDELPWRLIQGFFGVLAVFFLLTIFQIKLNLMIDPATIITFILITLLGYGVSFLFKSLILLSALWFTDISGLKNLVGLLVVIFAGFVIPLHLLPPWLTTVAYLLPFPFMVYYPVLSFLGKLTTGESLRVLIVQCLWIAILFIGYRVIWRQGLKKFTGVGQ